MVVRSALLAAWFQCRPQKSARLQWGGKRAGLGGRCISQAGGSRVSIQSRTAMAWPHATTAQVAGRLALGWRSGGMAGNADRQGAGKGLASWASHPPAAGAGGLAGRQEAPATHLRLSQGGRK